MVFLPVETSFWGGCVEVWVYASFLCVCVVFLVEESKREESYFLVEDRSVMRCLANSYPLGWVGDAGRWPAGFYPVQVGAPRTTSVVTAEPRVGGAWH